MFFTDSGDIKFDPIWITDFSQYDQSNWPFENHEFLVNNSTLSIFLAEYYNARVPKGHPRESLDVGIWLT